MNLISGKRYYSCFIAVYFVAAALCGALRIVLKLHYMEFMTGFYHTQTGYATLLNVLLFATAAGLFLISHLHKSGSDYPVYHKSPFSGTLSILSGGAIVAYTLLEKQIYPLIEQNYSSALLQIRDTACLILGLCAGAAMVVMGICMYMPRPLPSAIMLLGIVPCLWQLFMLMTRFNGFAVVTTISDNLLAVLFMICATLFLIGQSRTLFGLSKKDGRNYTIPAGLCTSLCGFLLVIPNYLYSWLNQTPIPAPMLGIWESVYIFCLSAYALAFVLGMIRSIKIV